jgi:2-amino-4-hydroxy-6-hydroxymethyldihydropteridine diphosphokinase
MKKKLVLSLGSNLGNRYAYIQQAIRHINTVFDTTSTCSSYYTTPPWGETNQARFINMALYLYTDNSLPEAFNKLQIIEAEMGRIKTKKWGPRSIDIDILFYDDEIVRNEILIVPHPYLHQRIFVLKPLYDILPLYVHPQLHKSVTQLISAIEDDTSLFCR